MSNGRSIGSQAAREAVSEAAKYDWRLLRRLWTYLRPYRGVALLSLVLLMGNSAVGVVPPVLTQIAVDRYLLPDADVVTPLHPWLPDGEMAGLGVLALVYLATLLLSVGTRSGQIHAMNWTGQRVMRDIRERIFRHLQRLPVSYFDRTPSGRLVTRATTDVDVLNELFTSGLVAVAGDVLTLVFAFGAMLYLSPQLTLVYLGVAPLVLVVSVIFRKHARDSFRAVRAAVARLASFLQECFTGISEIQLFNHEAHSQAEFEKINERHRQANYRAVRAHALFFPVIEWINVAGLAALVVFGGQWVVDGTLSTGVLLAFLQYGTRVFRPIQDLAEKYNVLQGAMAGAERIFELLDTKPPDIQEGSYGRDGPKGPGIEFRNVWFAYRGEDWVLRDVSFELPPGKTLAVVGHTGAGKTTLINLLLRFYEIQRGAILVDGRDIREWSRDALREQFSVVLQDPALVRGTIGANISLEDPAVPADRVRRAAADARLAGHIESLPLAYDEPLSERGGGLSTGQKQLLGFARALARDRPFLMLDEATSSVDPDTERRIQETVSIVLRDRTSIVIAHRLSTIRQASSILVLHKGSVVEHGTHAELLAGNGTYARLHRLQSLAAYA